MTAIDLALLLAVVSVIGGPLLIMRRRAWRRLSRVTRDGKRSAPFADRLWGASALLIRWKARSIAVGGAAGAVLGWLAGGPVAAFVLALYAAVAVAGWRARVVRQHADQAQTALLDAIDAASADLRAGLVPTSGAEPGFGMRRTDAAVRLAVERLDTACRISEALGTPLADLLDQVDSDLRARQRLRASVEAQTSGARATAVLLVGLPIVGLWIGAGLGVDPVGQLLHTRIGAGCAVVATLLQCGGLLWTNRIVDGALRDRAAT